MLNSTDGTTGRFALGQEATLRLGEKLGINAAIKINVTEALNVFRSPFEPGADELMMVVRVDGLSEETLVVVISLGADTIEDISKTVADLAQDAYREIQSAVAWEGIAAESGAKEA